MLFNCHGESLRQLAKSGIAVNLLLAGWWGFAIYTILLEKIRYSNKNNH